MNIEKAQKIEGAMELPELEWLAEQAYKSQYIAEVGCWRGRSTRAMGDNTRGFVFAVDHWNGSEEHKDYLKDKPKDFIYNAFRENVGDLITDGKVIPIRLYSVQASMKIWQMGYSMDMVFIDASHDYDNVKNDIQSWKMVIINGGILCGHDYGYPPVQQAVDEMIPNRQHVPNTSIWYTTVRR